MTLAGGNLRFSCMRRIREKMIEVVRFRSIAILILLVGACSNFVSGQALPQPASLAFTSSGDLVVLGAEGSIHLLKRNSERFAVSGQFHIPSNERPAALAAGFFAQQDIILICSNITSDLVRGKIAMYSLSGNQLHTWNFRQQCAGLDYDPRTKTVYFSSSDHSEIYQIDLNRESGYVSFVTEIPGISNVGPVAYDSTDHKLWIGDSVSGGVYAYDFGTKRSNLVFSGIGSVLGLHLSASSSLLYVADARARQIVILEKGKNGELNRSRVLRGFREPSEAISLPDGSVFVSDQEQNKVFIFNSAGELKEIIGGN
jgi:hypothetical protein